MLKSNKRLYIYIITHEHDISHNTPRKHILPVTTAIQVTRDMTYRMCVRSKEEIQVKSILFVVSLFDMDYLVLSTIVIFQYFGG